MRTSSRVPPLAAVLLAVGGCRAAASSPAVAPTTAWEPMGDGITCGVSGLAPAPGGAAWGGDRLVLVHDNKSAGEPRVATLTFDARGHATYRPVTWRYDAALRARHAALLGAAPDSVPVDLEAVAAVPGHTGAFYGVTSRGTVYRFALVGGGSGADSAVVDEALALPPPGDSVAALANYEGFVALPRGDGAVLGVWADRGADARAGVLRWGVLDASRGVVETRVLDSVRVPWPTRPEVRHVSDLALRGDTLLATAASDSGDAGPFASAVYRLGTVRVEGETPRLRRLPDGGAPAPLLRLDGRKAEAIAVLADGGRSAARVVVGTDDELQGGALLRAALPRDAGAVDVPATLGAIRATNACTPAPAPPR